MHRGLESIPKIKDGRKKAALRLRCVTVEEVMAGIIKQQDSYRRNARAPRSNKIYSHKIQWVMKQP